MDQKASDTEAAYVFGPFRLVPRESLLLREGEPVSLTPRAFDLLRLLVESAGHLKTREELVEALWPKTVVGESSLAWNVSAVRKALGDDRAAPRYIETVPTRGYRFIAPVTVGVAGSAEEAGRGETHRRSRWLWLTAAGLVAAAVVAGVLVKAWPHLFPESEATVTAPRRPSVAVLPFENLSADKGNAYFAAGMQDLILTKLADIGDLKVISRTSTLKYKSHPKDLELIGRQLGVATILEGSVQKAGNVVLIDVQLIDTKTGAHIWAQSYRRTLADVFGIEGEVAAKIAATLNAKLTAPETRQLASAPTTNAAAYNAYLRGRTLAHRIGTLNGAVQKRQVADYREAVAQDPHFALAWARLASAELNNYWLFEPTPAVLAVARGALARAQALAPAAAATQLALGDYDYYGRVDYRDALLAYKNALARAPNNVAVLRRVGRIERRLGRWKMAVTHYRQALTLDPLNLGLLEETANTFIALRDFANARVLLNRALALNPGTTEATILKAWIDLSVGESATAGKALASLRVDPKTVEAITLEEITNEQILVHDYSGAVRAARAALAGPSCQSSASARWDCYIWLGYAERLTGQAAAARGDLRHALAAASAYLAQATSRKDKALGYATLGLSDALLAHKAAALAAAHKAVALLPPSKDAFSGPLDQQYLAWVAAWVGEPGVAINLLRHLLSVPYVYPVTVPLLRADPRWNPLRVDPRFQALLEKYAKYKPASAASATLASTAPND